MSDNLPEPIITEEERKLLFIILALKELKLSKSHLTSARWHCTHAGGLGEFEGHLRKILKDINAMIEYFDNVYKNNKILYNKVKMLYDSLETVIEPEE